MVIVRINLWIEAIT